MKLIVYTNKALNIVSLLEPHFIFQYDTSLDYKDIILTRIENYILIGEIDKANSTFTG